MSPLVALARALTLFRFVAIVPFVRLLDDAVASGAGSAALGVLYVAVALSDWSDGRIARRANAASAAWGRLDAAADITFNAATLAAAAWLGIIAPGAPIAVVVLGAGFLFRGRRDEGVEDRPGKLAGVLFYALVGLIAGAAAFPGILGAGVLRGAGHAVALYAAGVVSARLAMSSWRRWTNRSV